jgi:hypothetical protein
MLLDRMLSCVFRSRSLRTKTTVCSIYHIFSTANFTLFIKITSYIYHWWYIKWAVFTNKCSSSVNNDVFIRHKRIKIMCFRKRDRPEICPPTQKIISVVKLRFLSVISKYLAFIVLWVMNEGVGGGVGYTSCWLLLV